MVPFCMALRYHYPFSIQPYALLIIVPTGRSDVKLVKIVYFVITKSIYQMGNVLTGLLTTVLKHRDATLYRQ